MSGRTRRSAVAGLVLAAAGALLAAGPAGATPAIVGSGGDSVDPLIGKWQVALSAAPYSTSVDYSADGAGAARKEFVAGNTDFAVTSDPFTAEEKAQLTTAKRTYASFPIAAGSIAFLYHLFDAQGQPIKGLQLTGPTLTKIFTGNITNWNDAEIVAENPGVTLPARVIIPTVRGQASGATYTVTSYLRAQNPAVWKAFMEDPSRNFKDEPVEVFPFFAGVDSRTSSFAVADVVRATESSDGRIAYVDNAWASKATADGADIMKIKNAAGNYVLPTPANAQKTIDAWKMDADGHLTPDFAVADAAAYPVGIVHEMVVPTSGLTAAKAAALRTFAEYGLKTGQAAAKDVGDPALPAPVVTKSLVILDTAIPPTTATTTTTTAAGTGTDVSAADASNSGTTDGLAFTGAPALGWMAGAGGALAGVGAWMRRRRVR